VKYHRTTLKNFAIAIAHSRDVHGADKRIRVLGLFRVLIVW
jgi:hypothetical protein